MGVAARAAPKGLGSQNRIQELQSCPFKCTFWINHYLKIMFYKFHALDPPPLRGQGVLNIRMVKFEFCLFLST